ncbi:IS200/IS605 family transposase [Spirosoma agri]|uniref:IS200/IS605 family transposase n=1 Tax=Spirosoma agri TaxID=1987381 RepID=A0A6M0ILC4_9BACT|nr:IS200/IS605 family transposase [Spirosoma agri]NEU68201.1 IS200/IS605 family transposase [Spirosoma agri]
MSNYIALYVHLIWTTKYREPVLFPAARYALFAHIREEAVKNNIDIRIINGVADHVHCLVALRSTQSIADVGKRIKGESARWLNQSNKLEGLFVWQDGYGAISVSPQHVLRVTRYIFNQEQHHTQKVLLDELQLFAQYADSP